MSHDSMMSSLVNPYAKKHRQHRVVRSLITKISTINRKYNQSGDFIQNKYRFKENARKVVRVPETYFYTTDSKDMAEFIWETGHKEFVLKPNHLSRGLGARILTKRARKYHDINGDVLTLAELKEEMDAALAIRRGAASNTGLLCEERIRSHKKLKKWFYGDGIADIRFIYCDKKFVFGVARFPTESSSGYGNIIRGGAWGVFLDEGKFTNDERFIRSQVQDGVLPYFEEMLKAGYKVIGLYHYPFQAVDMTVDDRGVAVLESERAPQIDYYITHLGGRWLYRKIKAIMGR